MIRTGLLLLIGLVVPCQTIPGVIAEADQEISGPVPYVYAVRDTTELRAYVFSPSEPSADNRSGIVIFHGGGWHIGAPQWGFGVARHYAGRGMVAVSAQYRLSDQADATPLEAMADARDVIRWVRENADWLGVDPARIAAHGWSAGGHLAACAAIFDDDDSASSLSCSPDALVLESPALSVAGDMWFQRLLGDKADAREASPVEHVRAGLPPTLILQGDADTVTPIAGAMRFREHMRAAGNLCELEVYEGYGHLFTPAGIPDDGVPQSDPEIEAQALARADEFLVSLGFMDGGRGSEDGQDQPSN